jgi:hypothetical protein
MSTKMLSFGEAMIRFLPMEDVAEADGSLRPSAAQNFLSCACISPKPGACRSPHAAPPLQPRGGGARSL